MAARVFKPLEEGTGEDGPENKQDADCAAACRVTWSAIKMHTLEALAILSLMAIFLLCYYHGVPFVIAAVDALTRLDGTAYWLSVVGLGAASGLLAALLPIVLCVERGPFLSMAQTYAILRRKPEDRRADDLAKAVALHTGDVCGR